VGKKTHIKIDIAVRDYYGCNNTAIVFSGMMFWFQIMPDGFYKFKQACKKHPLWRKGDSWGEELGMSRKTLDPILDKLVNKHKTKGEFLKQTDPFKGKMFASYTNHKTSQTYYFMNKEAVDEFLGSLNIKRKEIHPPSPICKGIESKKQEPLVMSQNQPCDVPTVHPLACARLTAINTQTNTSLVRDVPSEVGELAVEEEKLSSKKMVEIWNSQISDQVVWYPSLSTRLYKVLVDYFGSCLESFKKYCESIASSQFLMGKAPNSKFKAFLFWVIKPEVIKSILQGAYGVKNIMVKVGIGSEEEKLKYERQTMNSSLCIIKDKIQTVKNKNDNSIRQIIAENIKTLSPDIKDEALKRVQARIGADSYFKETLINSGVHGELERHVRAKLKFDNFVVPQQLLDDQKRVEDNLAAINGRLKEIELEKRDIQIELNNLMENVA
jgi:hypothetical protein